MKGLILCIMFLLMFSFSLDAIERDGDNYAPGEVIIGFQQMPQRVRYNLL